MTARFLFAALALALAAVPATAADKLTVLLDWFVNPDHAPLVIAEEGGFFERHGLDVELIAPADPSAPPRLVAAGQADIAITYQPDLMMLINEDLPLVRFATLIETPLNALIVLKDGPVKTLADLKGKKVGFSIAGIQDAYLGAILKSVGLTADDVEMVNVNFNLVSALLSGQVDAAIDGYRNFELTQLDIEGKPGIAFFPEEHGVPIYDELVFVAKSDRRDDPRQHADRAQRPVELPPAMVRDHDRVGAEIGGDAGVLLVEDALEDQLAAPFAPDPVHVLP